VRQTTEGGAVHIRSWMMGVASHTHNGLLALGSRWCRATHHRSLRDRQQIKHHEAEDGRVEQSGVCCWHPPSAALQSVSLTREQTGSVQISSLERSVIGSRCMLPDRWIFVGSLPQAQPGHAATGGRDIAAGVLCSMASRRTMGYRVACRIRPPCLTVYTVWMMRTCWLACWGRQGDFPVSADPNRRHDWGR
jgi:hypothetical protein